MQAAVVPAVVELMRQHLGWDSRFSLLHMFPSRPYQDPENKLHVLPRSCVHLGLGKPPQAAFPGFMEPFAEIKHHEAPYTMNGLGQQFPIMYYIPAAAATAVSKEGGSVGTSCRSGRCSQTLPPTLYSLMTLLAL